MTEERIKEIMLEWWARDSVGARQVLRTVAAEARKEGIEEACSLLTWKSAGIVRRKLLAERLTENGK